MTKKFSLRAISADDVELIYNWRNSERVRSNMFHSQVIAWEEHKQWFTRMLESNVNVYKVFEVKNEPVGLVYFTDINTTDNLCYWGFYIGAKDCPRGTGLVMGFLGLDFGFNHLAVRKICSECFAFNTASIKFHERLGFVREGYFFKQVLRNEKYEDVIRFALFKEGWQKHRLDIQAGVFGEDGDRHGQCNCYEQSMV